MYLAVLDANVLFPNYLRDVLLTLAEEELFDLLWSEEILEEMKRNVIARRANVTEEKLDRTISLMNAAFEDAQVEREAIEQLIPSMTNDEKDRHVLAAAVARGAEGIVTENTKHFPEGSCDPYGITVTTADEFLCVLFDVDRDLVAAALQARVTRLRKPPLTLADVLIRLEADNCGESTQRLGDHLGIGDEIETARTQKDAS